MKNEWISQRFVEYFPKKNKILAPPGVHILTITEQNIGEISKKVITISGE